MPSQFFGLNIAYKGLLASNAALNTASNNIANVQTEGYSRQHVVQQASDALRVFQTYGCAGAGVDTISIERIRNEFYDSKYWEASTKYGEFDTKKYYMAQLETYFKDDGTSTGFKTIFDQFSVTGIQEVMKNAGSDNAKAQFIGYSENLTEYFIGMNSNLEKVQHDLNQELKLKVDEINSLAGELASLNKQINVIELTGTKANELRDRRSLILDQLSKIVNIETKEIPVVDPYDPERLTGANRFLVRIGGGQLLVNTDEYTALSCVARKTYEKVNQSDIDGLYDVFWQNGERFNIYDRTLGGTLQGLVELRDGNNTEFFTGTITGLGKRDVTTNHNKVTHDTVTVEVSRQYLMDLNKTSLSDTGGVISLGNQQFYYDSWSYTCSYDTAGNPTYSYEFVLSGNELNQRSVTNDRVGMSADIGVSVDYQGIPYYMKQMNEWVRTFSQKTNDILRSGFTSDGIEGVDLFVGKKPTENEQYVFGDQNRYDLQKDGNLTVNSTEESYYMLTAKNFQVLGAMKENPGILATKKDRADGVDQYDIFTELNSMIQDKEKMSFRGSKSGEFLQCILSDVALNAGNANTFAANYKNISGSIDNQRISISGVDEDEEAVNLVKFQNGYNLASKMIQTLTEVYDRLILQTGV